MTNDPPVRSQFAICVDNHDHPASLEQWKIYSVTHDPDAERCDLLRVIDESGEDYLYPTACFRFIDLPPALEELYRASARQ